MVNQLGSHNPTVDKIWWALALTIIAGVVSGYYYYPEASLLLRVLALLISSGLVVWIVLKTTLGQGLWSKWLASLQEVQKIHWPTRQETLQTTGAVLLMTFIMGIVLCSADAILLRAVKWLMTGHWGA